MFTSRRYDLKFKCTRSIFILDVLEDKVSNEKRFCFFVSRSICSCVILHLTNEFSAFQKLKPNIRIFQLEGRRRVMAKQSCGKGRQFEHKGAKSHLQCFQVSLLICEAAHETRLRVTRARREKFPCGLEEQTEEAVPGSHGLEHEWP